MMQERKIKINKSLMIEHCYGCRCFTEHVIFWTPVIGNHLECIQCRRQSFHFYAKRDNQATLEYMADEIQQLQALIHSEIAQRAHLENRIIDLEKHLHTITQQLDEVYFAPEMPGYIQALQSFNSGGAKSAP